MQLTFKLPHLSIKDFPDTELPKFTVITGVNGAGKSHLLQSISNGKIAVDIAPDPNHMVKLYDWLTLVPSGPETAQFQSVFSPMGDLRERLTSRWEGIEKQLNAWVENSGCGKELETRGISPLDLNKELVQEISVVDEGALERFHRLWEHCQSVCQNLDQERRVPRMDVRSGFDAEGFRLFHATESELAQFFWGEAEMFQQSFAHLFFLYFELRKHNQLRQLMESKGETPDGRVYTDQEFEEAFGSPPWDAVNRTLTEAGLDFRISYPTKLETVRFTPQLFKKVTSEELRFDELSSGEKILMSLAFALYNLKASPQTIVQPKILLFDEIDAPLHPAMSRQLVQIIENVLVGENDLNVILATHSPATVAVSPENSIFVMKPGALSIQKVGRQQALAALTTDVPTLSVDYTGRRQVFVESEFDARRYENLYKSLAPKIESERSLNFIAVGGRGAKGDENTGCDQVRRIVGELNTSGNTSVFGLIDWDGKNCDSGNTFVLAQNQRYSIENCLLDPLLVAALVADENLEAACQVGWPNGKGFSDFRSLTWKECQHIADEVERTLLGNKLIGSRQKSTIFYLRKEVEVDVATEILEMRGHDLENLVKDKFPSLRRFNNSGELLFRIVDKVLREHPEMVPMEIYEVFKRIVEFGPEH